MDNLRLFSVSLHETNNENVRLYEPHQYNDALLRSQRQLRCVTERLYFRGVVV